MQYLKKCASPLGELTLASDGERLTGLWLPGQKYHGGGTGTMAEGEAAPVFDAAKNWLERYFSGARPVPSELPLAPSGSDFRRGVWEILLQIPCGELMTYGEIAAKMAKKMNRASMSAQAVGGAVGHNPISIIIPCHRVVGADGSLTGYAGGLAAKVALLTLEGVDTSTLTAPKKGTAL